MLFVLQVKSVAEGDQPTTNVVLDNGTRLRGKACPDQPSRVRCFFGIPYAEPPTGDKRFRPPVAYNYTGKDVITTKHHGSRCFQGRDKGSEDCLFMDLYAPKQSITPKGVMVFIHGGCFTNGGPIQYNSADMVLQGEVIVVVVHYRLGVFGFLGADQLRERDTDHHTTGNYGNQDILLALQWVQDNIHSFHGDPDNITIFGQSSGAGTVAALLAMPDEYITYKGKKLFHAAIMQSGGYNSWSSQPMKVAQMQYAQVMNNLNCNIDNVDCLINTSAEDLQAAFGSATPWTVPPCRDGCQISPAIDGKILPAMVAGMSERARRVPTIQGWCQNDGADMISYDINVWGYDMTQDEYEEWWDHFRGSGFTDERELYFNAETYQDQGSHSKYFMAADDAATTALYQCSIHKQINVTDPEDLYAYVFDTKSSGSPNELVTHSSELDYLFDPLAIDNQTVSTQMQTWWTNFAKYHNPNGPSGNAWPKVEASNPRVMRISDNLGAEDWPQASKCSLWQGIENGNFFSTCQDVYWEDLNSSSKGAKDEL